MEKVLVIGAHPDDETLGVGGTIALHSRNGDKIYVLIFADGESARSGGFNNIEKRQKQAKKACALLGVTVLKFLNYPDQKLDTISLVDLAKQIEDIIRKWHPTIIYTHYGEDLNQDHKRIFDATLIAARPIPNSSVTQLICYETLSSTDWNPMNKFHPNLFIDIDDVLEKKIKAFSQYKNEIMTYPHPRSKQGIMIRAQFWGSTVGVKHAEAFLRIREVIKKIKTMNIRS